MPGNIEVKKAYTTIQQVFLNSRVNGAKYDGDALPVHPLNWPDRTFLRLRLAEIRAASRNKDTGNEANNC